MPWDTLIKHYGIAAIIGILLGFAAVAYIEPTTPGGTLFLVGIVTLVAIVLYTIVRTIFGR
jgi:hypothetical protein